MKKRIHIKSKSRTARRITMINELKASATPPSREEAVNLGLSMTDEEKDQTQAVILRELAVAVMTRIQTTEEVLGRKVPILIELPIQFSPEDAPRILSIELK